MSEVLGPIDFKEVLKPTITPEMGFQSYEQLAGDPEWREQQKQAFLKDEIVNPRLDYPYIDEGNLKSGIDRLQKILDVSRQHPNTVAADAIWDSAGYRMAEMFWLLQVKRLNEMADQPNSENFLINARRYQELNEQLYGVPSEELKGQVYGEIIFQAESKPLHEKAQKLLDELKFGTEVTIAGKNITIPGIAGKEQGRLPEDVMGTLAPLGEVLKEDFADVFALVDEYWDVVVEARPVSESEEKGFTVDDMKCLFEMLHELRDPENKSGISVVINKTSSQLAWDTPTMSIQIGAKRLPITDKITMVAKMIHEYGVHAGRAVNGLRTDLPVLGTGVYSDADQNEKSDYLTFEEGFASLSEIAIDGSFSRWKPLHLSRYLAAASSYDGLSFRQAFEINWRARVLMELKPGQEPTDALINKEKKQAHISVIRLRRGSPTHLEEHPVLTFNKDLAYLTGKVDGLKYLASIGDDKEALRRLFKGKFDPTNHRQNELANQYIHV